MEILQIVGAALVVTVLILVIKPQRPELALQISLVFAILIFLFMLDKISGVIKVLEELSGRANLNKFYMATILKIIGVAYIAEFGAQVCRDAGEGAIASKVEFAAKIIIMVLAVPIIVAILDSLLKLLA
ncbi:MAG: stage III sporulation protein AD [Syntrophomonadaceae bacterium]|nr:stage III sporulation protein AD [Syntrophomonadaceae bacterium]